jgi:hypothetical protein
VKAKAFATEADLCAAFILWLGKDHPEVRCYAEWAGWDILIVHPEGWQLGVQAKLRLNAEVIGQAAPDDYTFHFDHKGPDFRAVLVPTTNPLSEIASRLGLEVFRPYVLGFAPSLNHRAEWIDWNPGERHALPGGPTDSVAGSPCPVSLTAWKLAALQVLAELEVRGVITAKRIKAIGIDPGRWTTYRWLEPAEKRGDWVRAKKCPPFDTQHPSAYALALAKARAVPVLRVPA